MILYQETPKSVFERFDIDKNIVLDEPDKKRAIY